MVADSTQRCPDCGFSPCIGAGCPSSGEYVDLPTGEECATCCETVCVCAPECKGCRNRSGVIRLRGDEIRRLRARVERLQEEVEQVKVSRDSDRAVYAVNTEELHGQLERALRDRREMSETLGRCQARCTEMCQELRDLRPAERWLQAERQRDHHRETLRLFFNGGNGTRFEVIREREQWLFEEDPDA